MNHLLYGQLHVGIDLTARKVCGAFEVGVYVPGHDAADTDVVGLQFVAQGKSVTVEGGLAGGIHTLEGDAEDGGHGTDEDDAPALAASLLLTAHEGKGGLEDTDGTIDVDVKLAVHLCFRGELNGTSYAHAGTQEEEVDAACLLTDEAEGFTDGFGTYHVAGDVLHALLGHFAAREVEDAVAEAHQARSGGPTYAGGGSGDDCCFHCRHNFCKITKIMRAEQRITPLLLLI